MSSSSAGTSFQFFIGRGKILTDFLGGGQNMKRKKNCAQKHKKITAFQIQGGANTPCLPTNDVSAVRYNK